MNGIDRDTHTAPYTVISSGETTHYRADNRQHEIAYELVAYESNAILNFQIELKDMEIFL